MARHSYAIIENEAAYQDAIARRIKENARKGRGARWMAADPSRKELVQRMYEHVYFQMPAEIEALFDAIDGGYENILTPAERAHLNEWRKKRDNRYVNPFIVKMHENYQEWNSLTDGQEKAVREAFAKMDAKDAEFAIKREAAKVERAALDAGSQHVGTVGERRDFRFTVSLHTTFAGTFGLVHVIVGRDDAGNVIVYKGSNGFNAERGSVLAVKATIKEHGEREGVRQTVIARPKLL